ncbi:MAG: hypothetical protein Q7S32_02745 [bacterium]|nr:hypothetical protein [bacterium]
MTKNKETKTKITTDHDEIRKWAEKRDGIPSKVKGVRGGGIILRIDFPGFSGEDTLEEITWDEWFETFEEQDLAFLYQDKIDNEPSHFNKLVSREGNIDEDNDAEDEEADDEDKEEKEEEDERKKEDDQTERREEAAETNLARPAHAEPSQILR